MTEATRVRFPRPRRRTLAAFLCPTVLFIAGIAAAQEKIDLDAASRIRDTALNHSQIMEMVGYLTDVTGPRLTGSPNLKRAEEYARDKLHEWGLENAHLEAWDLLAVAGRWRVSPRMCFRLGSARSLPIPKPGVPARTASSVVKWF